MEILMYVFAVNSLVALICVCVLFYNMIRKKKSRIAYAVFSINYLFFAMHDSVIFHNSIGGSKLSIGIDLFFSALLLLYFHIETKKLKKETAELEAKEEEKDRIERNRQNFGR